MIGQTVTSWLILATVCVWVVWDVVAVLIWGDDATESVTLRTLAHKYPSIPFAAGVLVGHLWF